MCGRKSLFAVCIFAVLVSSCEPDVESRDLSLDCPLFGRFSKLATPFKHARLTPKSQSRSHRPRLAHGRLCDSESSLTEGRLLRGLHLGALEARDLHNHRALNIGNARLLTSTQTLLQQDTRRRQLSGWLGQAIGPADASLAARRFRGQRPLRA